MAYYYCPVIPSLATIVVKIFVNVELHRPTNVPNKVQVDVTPVLGLVHLLQPDSCQELQVDKAGDLAVDVGSRIHPEITTDNNHNIVVNNKRFKE